MNNISQVKKVLDYFFYRVSFFSLALSLLLLTALTSRASNDSGATDDRRITVTTSFPAGVYIIDMGQSPQTINNGLKPYGLVYALINAGIPVNWAIEPTKAKDGIDFYATTLATGNKAYRGGSFIINTVVYPAAIPIINSWKAANAGLVVDGPTTTSFSAPIYKTLTIWPKAFLDSDNDNKITPYFANAGIPSSSYQKNADPTMLPQCGSVSGTQDIYILPHADPQDWQSSWITALQNFILNGGAMWAGCHGVSAMENIPGCSFLSSTGLVLWTDHNSDAASSEGTPPFTYRDHGHPIMQLIGTFDGATANGSEEIYVPKTTWLPTTSITVYDPDYVNFEPNPDTVHAFPSNPAATVAYGPAFGNAGLVMYEAGHSINSNNGTVAENVAAQRAFFNFLLLVGGQPQNNITPPNIANQTTTTCSGVAFNHTPSGAAANVRYTWTAPTGTGFTGGSAQTTAQTSISQTLTNITSLPVTAIYTVTPRIGGCIGNPFTLTVTIYPTPPTITLTSGAGTNIVTTPTNVAMVNITYVTTNATSATFSGLPPGVTGTWASNVITISGTPTAVGVYNFTVNVLGYDTCGGVSATGTITTYVCPTFSLLSTTSSSVNVCLGSASLITLTANPANLPVGNYLVSYEIQGVAQPDAVMNVTTEGTGSFVYTGFTSAGNRTVTITRISSGLCSSVITANNIFTITIVATLAAPTPLPGSNATCNQITANWSSLTGATYYEIDVSTSSTFASFVPGYNALNVGLVNSYTIIGLATGTTYYYRIRVHNGNCISANSATITYSTASIPGAPSGLTTLVNACDELTVSWSAGAGATSYEIQWSTSASNFATILGSATGITSLSYTITGLSNGVAYRYRVRSINGCGQSAYSTSGNITAAGSAPGRPGSVSVSNIFCNQFTVSWPSVATATSYTIEWSTAAANYAPILGTATGITALNYTITGLNPAIPYVFRVYSENGCGLSSNSRAGSATTLSGTPSAPTGVAASSITCTQFTVSWTASAGALSYTVERASNALFSMGLFTVTGITANNYTFTGLNAGSVYFYRVRAVSCNASGNATGSPNFVTTSSTLPATPTISTTGSLTFCENDSVTLGATPGGISYDWFLNGSLITGETTAFLFVTTAGTYTVRSNAASGCQSLVSAPAVVVVQGLPTASAGGSQSICSNASATVSGANATNGTILWTENGAGSITSGATTLTPTYTPAPADAGNTVILTMAVTSNNTCAPQIQTATYAINVLASPSPPTVGTITQPTNCASNNGSVVLSGLPIGGALNPGNITYSGTSYTVSGLSPGTYNFTVTSNGCTSNISSNVVINPSSIINKIWQGTIDRDWNNALNWSPNSIPTAFDCVVIPSAANSPLISGTAYAAFAYSLTIQNGGQLQIDPSNSITVTDLVDVNPGGQFLLKDSASLVQINNTGNQGIMNIERITQPMYRFDYTYWGSPVTQSSGFTLGMLSPNTLPDKYFSWIPTVGNSFGNWFFESPTTVMNPTKGYIVRAPQTFSFTPNVKVPYTANFFGTPNNGDILCPIYFGSLPLSNNNDKYNLLGNPYPCAVDAELFLSDPANTPIVDGTIYFWTHNSPPSATNIDPFYGDFILNYAANDYASWNKLGGTGTTSAAGSGGAVPNGFIASGQGFFCKSRGTAVSGNPVVFKNSMRVKFDNNQFFRNSMVASHAEERANNSIEKHRLWLNLINTGGSFNQILVGYANDASNGYDRDFDGVKFTDNNTITFYSINEDRNLVIQGRALPFNNLDLVPLGYKSTVNDTFSIRIDHFDGLFAAKSIFLEDRFLNIIHDLKQSPYQFTSAIGTFDERFVLRYTNNSSLDTSNFEASEMISALLLDNHLSVKSSKILKEIRIFDISGKMIGNFALDHPQRAFDSKLIIAEGIYILKATLDNEKIISQKLIHKK